jgi:hypothetical protein
MTATARATNPSLLATPATDPVLAALERIERRLAAVEHVTSALAPLVDAAPGGLAMLTDTIDTLAAKVGDTGVDLDARLHSVLRAVEVATSPRAVNGLAALVESKMLDAKALAVISRLADALAESGDAKPIGTWGLLRSLRDPDVQRALGFLVAIARDLGRHLSSGELEQCREHLLAVTTEES